MNKEKMITFSFLQAFDSTTHLIPSNVDYLNSKNTNFCLDVNINIIVKQIVRFTRKLLFADTTVWFG